MTYETAKALLGQSIEFGYRIIENAIRTMPTYDFEKIPVIDDHSKIVAQKYGVCFTVYRNADFKKYYRMYLISSYVFREEKPANHPD